MRATKHILFLIITSSLLLFSCTKDNPAYNRENIVGLWVLDTKDGELIPEEEYTVYAFEKGSKLSFAGVQVQDNEEGSKWWNQTLIYGVLCSDFAIRGTLAGFNGFISAVMIQQEYEIIEHKDSVLTIKPIIFTVEDAEMPLSFSQATMNKMSKSYDTADSLKGVWEIKSIATEPVNTFRLEFIEGGKLNFYSKAPNGTWIFVDAGVLYEDYYNAYPKVLAATLYNNELFGEKDKWDVAVFNIVRLSTSSSEMILSKDGVEYSFMKVSSSGGK